MEVVSKSYSYKAALWPLKRFSRTWRLNRSQIIRITLINFAVTLLSELFVRKALVQLGMLPQGESLFHMGKLHTQVIINLLMTVVASLFGSVVYFFESFRARYLFFICFSLVNSLIAQGIVASFLLINLSQFKRRIFFDLCYSASAKYLSFEFIRKPLASKFSSYKKMFITRKSQDIFMTVVKAKALFLFGLFSS